MQSIKKLMLEMHGDIISIFHEFELNINDNLMARRLLSKFRDILEKHFSIEEAGVFNISQSIAGDTVSYIFELMQEHGEIIEIVDNIRDGLIKGVVPNVYGLKSLLEKHIKIENEFLYPNLDEKIGEEERERIIEMIQKISP